MAIKVLKWQVKIPEELSEKNEVFLKHVSTGKAGGIYGYTAGKAKPSTTSIGMYCQQLMGARKGKRQDESASYLNMHRPILSIRTKL